jgi:hypothetical protein
MIFALFPEPLFDCALTWPPIPIPPHKETKTEKTVNQVMRGKRFIVFISTSFEQVVFRVG